MTNGGPSQGARPWQAVLQYLKWVVQGSVSGHGRMSIHRLQDLENQAVGTIEIRIQHSVIRRD
jgi:hypothetical protein